MKEWRRSEGYMYWYVMWKDQVGFYRRKEGLMRVIGMYCIIRFRPSSLKQAKANQQPSEIHPRGISMHPVLLQSPSVTDVSPCTSHVLLTPWNSSLPTRNHHNDISIYLSSFHWISNEIISLHQEERRISLLFSPSRKCLATEFCSFLSLKNTHGTEIQKDHHPWIDQLYASSPSDLGL